MMTDTLRAFVALGLPKAVAPLLGDLQEGLKRHRFAIRWVRPGGIHLTLKFLGDIPAAGIPDIVAALGKAAAGMAPLTLGVKGVGVFPGIKRPRVLWAGLCGETAGLMALQQAVEASLADAGVARDKRPFKSHLTIGRVKGHVPPTRLAEALQAFSIFRSDDFSADAVTLFKSDLQPGGAVYTCLKRIPLM